MTSAVGITAKNDHVLKINQSPVYLHGAFRLTVYEKNELLDELGEGRLMTALIAPALISFCRNCVANVSGKYELNMNFVSISMNK